jgi:hypothetical protein
MILHKGIDIKMEGVSQGELLMDDTFTVRLFRVKGQNRGFYPTIGEAWRSKGLVRMAREKR